MLKPASGTPITIMSADVTVPDHSINQVTGELDLTSGRLEVAGSGRSRGEACNTAKKAFFGLSETHSFF